MSGKSRLCGRLLRYVRQEKSLLNHNTAGLGLIPFGKFDG
jgi:hypothetical protein